MKSVVIIEDPYTNKKYNILATTEQIENISNGNYEVANTLLQKAIEADNFSAAFKLISSDQYEESRDELHATGSIVCEDSNSNYDIDCDKTVINCDIDEEEKENEHSLFWAQKIPTADDKRATEELLALLNEDKWKRRMQDSKTRKKSPYKKLYETLTQRGFKVGNSTEHGIVRVSQKWRNLQKTYEIQNQYEKNRSRDHRKTCFFWLIRQYIRR